MSRCEWVTGEVTQWLLDHDGSKNGLCWVCKEPFKLGQTVVYEVPSEPRRYLVKLSRHEGCRE